MDAVRPEQQRMGDNVPEIAKFVDREPVSGGLSDTFRGATDMPGGTEWPTYPAEIWTEGEAVPGDSVRRVRRELG